MCGIVGVIGGGDAVGVLVEGLARLEYRGYDSAGVAVIGPTGLKVHKRAGRVDDLVASLPRRLRGDGRHRPHPMGDARRAQRRQRPSPRRCVGPRRRRPQRHRGERRRAAGQAGDRGCRAGLGHGHRGHRPADRPAGRGGPAPGAGGAGVAVADRRHLRPGRGRRPPTRPDRGGPQRQPGGAGRGPPRPLRRLGRDGAGAPHRPDRPPRRPRDGRAGGRLVPDLHPRRPAHRQAPRHHRGGGHRLRPGGPRTTCTRRSTSSRRPPSGPCGAGSTAGSPPPTWAASGSRPGTCWACGGSRSWGAGPRYAGMLGRCWWRA